MLNDLIAAASVAQAHKTNVERLIAEFDAKRFPVADAACSLYVDSGYLQSTLHYWSYEQTLSAYRDQVRVDSLLPLFMIPPKIKLTTRPIGEHGEGVRTFTVETERFKMYTDAWPLRQATADSAEYLWRRIGQHYELLERSPAQIRQTAALTQEDSCAHTANAAEFICVEHGMGWLAVNAFSAQDIVMFAQFMANLGKKIRVEIAVSSIQGEAVFELIDEQGLAIKSETLGGKTTSVYKRVIELDRDFDHYEVHFSGVGVCRVKRIK